MNRSDNLVPQSYWDNSYETCSFRVAPPEDQVRTWIESHIAPGTGDCIEIGCFPGRYLAVFGELGYRLNGIDMTPRAEADLSKWLIDCGYEVGEVARTDFFEFDTEQRFDIVCSFGFIEHFSNWQDVLRKHFDLVRHGGYLLVSTPNFRGLIQKLLHGILDSENLKRHVLYAMNPREWARLANNAGFEVLYEGSFGGFDFWVDNQKRNVLQRDLLRIVNCARPALSRVLPNSPLYSPYCGIVARRM